MTLRLIGVSREIRYNKKSKSYKEKLTRCPKVRRAISEPISSPMAIRAIPRTATP